ncbi:NADH pyrophosphatase [Gemmatimonadetes bacterium T265]|nr:NADH pyrophosphatase [Gemmatimonadetes bacterium T265]
MSDEPAPNLLSGVPLDRVAERRTDAAWVAATYAHPATRVVPVCDGRVLVTTVEDGRGAAATATDGASTRARALSVATFGPLAEATGDAGAWTTVLLGVGGATAYVAVDVPASDGDAVLARAGDGAAWSELRPAALALPEGEAALVAYARAMVWWHGRHGYCGVCGAATAVEEAGHVRACPRCAARHFPRTDPAVIVLVAHRPDDAGAADEACLLGSAPGWPERMYSTLAGFVEPGESLEDTVRREIYEEAGVRVDDVRYGSSQPWPFPQSLMLGFTARARDRTTRVDGTELRDARWFTRAALDAALADGSIWIPPRLSISRRLIEDWRNDRAR